MPTEIRMPRLVDSMTQGAVVAWRKREGDPVQAGEAIAEIEADKTTVDLESPAAGRCVRIVAPAGSEKVDVGAVLAILDESVTAGVSVVDEPAPATAATSLRANGHPPAPVEGRTSPRPAGRRPETGGNHPGSTPPPSPGAWPCRRGSISPRSAAAVRGAASSMATSSVRWA